MFQKRLLTVIALLSFILQSLFPSAAFAEDGAGLNLDLTSTAATISASSLFSSGNASSYTIDMGGTAHTVSSGDMLTPAQFLAVQQVSAGSAQSILLSNQGAAVGGSFVLNSSLSQSVSSLLIPQGVTGIHDFGTNNILNITGNLVNSGTFYGVSTGGASTATISAMNILNNQGGLLSTVLPAGGLAGFSNLLGGLNLSLIAVNDIVNAGSIYSAGALSATAGGSIINALPQGITGMAPIMQAMTNLNMQAANIVNQGTLMAQTGNINAAFSNLTNSGLIQSMLGNIAMQNLTSNVLNINNSLGIINAAGSFSVSNTQNLLGLDGSILKPELNINGGTLLANVVSMDAGDGHLRVNLEDMAGVLHVSAGTAKFGISAGTHPFVMGSFNITGDPDLDLTVASYDDGGAGFDADGGYIDLTTTAGDITFTGAITTVNSLGGAGGSVTMNSFGAISLADITTSGNTNGDAGAIQLTAATGITTGQIFALGGDNGGNGGSVTMQTTNGDITINGQMQLSGANAGVGNGGAVSLTADNGSISTNLINSLGGVGNGVLGGNGGGVSLSALNGTISMSQFLDSSARFNGSAGAVNIQSDGDISLVSVRANGPDSGTGNGATIDITSNSGQLISVFTASPDGNFIHSSADSPNSPVGSTGNGGAITINTSTGIAMGVGATRFSFRAEGGSLGGNGADINITTQGFADLEFISSSAGTVYSAGSVGNAGAVNITADAGMSVVSVRSEGGFNGGNGAVINLTATNGGATITAGTGGGLFLSSAAYTNGAGGDITVLADSDINIGDIYTWGRDDQNAGLVSITSSNTNVTTRFIDATSVNGTTGIGGTVTINGQAITTDFIDSSGAGGGGNVTLTGGTGNVTTTSIVTSSLAAGDGGDIVISTDGSITTTFLTTTSTGAGTGGDITFTSNSNSITTTTIDAQSSGVGNGGAITFEASTGITTGTIQTMGGVSAAGNGGLVWLNTVSGDVTAGDITTWTRIDGGTSGAITASTGNGNLNLAAVDATGGTGAVSGNAGSINLTATGGDLTATFISAAANVPIAAGPNGNGADVIINAGGTLTVTQTGIATYACGNGTAGSITINAGGDVTILDPFGITDMGLSSWGGIGSGGGGNISVTAGGFVFVPQVASNAVGVVTGGPAGPLTGVGNGGFINISAGTGIFIVNDCASSGGADGGNSGTVTLTSTTGNITVIGVLAATANNTAGNGADITVTASAGSITVNNITTTNADGVGNAGSIIMDATNGIILGNVEASGGNTSGDGGTITLTTTGGDLVANSYMNSRARGLGDAGDITLTASAGAVAVLDVDPLTGNAIDASGDGAGGDGGDVTINFDQSGAGVFIIDPNGVGITNGTKGNISTSADNNGNAGFLTINDAGGATNNITIELRGTINLDSLSGLDNSFNTSEAGGIIIINGDANGQLLGTLVASADSVTVNLARVGTTLNTGNVSSVNGAVSITLTGAGANLNMAAGSTISSNAGNDVTLQASNINMGAGSAVNPGASAIVTSNNIVVGDGSTGAITANGGGTISISAIAGQNLTFNKTAGAGIGTLNLTGGAVTINVTNGVLTNSASTLVSSNNNILVNLNGSSFTNNGTMTSVAPGGQLNLASTSGNLVISGATGILSAPTVTANNTGGSISLSQATVTGNLSGSANGNFSASTTGVGGLTVNNTVNAANGFVSLTTTGGAMNVLAGGTVTATTNVTLSGGTGVNIGAPAGAAVLLRAGVLAGGLDPNSISMADYDLTGITSPGAVSITSVAGNVVFGDSVTMRAFGSTLGVVSANNINIGTGADFIVQGGNLWLDAANIVNGTTGVSLTSVARYTTGTVVIDNTNIQNFVGGGVAVWAGNPGTNLNTYLNNLALSRTAAGTNNVSAGVNLAGSTTNYTNGQYVEMIAGGAGKIGATNSSFVANGGVISMDPPGDQLDFSNSAITAIGPQLIAVPSGGSSSSSSLSTSNTAGVGAAAAVATAEAVAGAGTGGLATRVPTDVTGPIVTGQENNDVAFSNETAITLTKAASQANDAQSSRFIVSMDSCQPFCFADDNEAAFLGKSGTKFALAGDRTLALKEGKIFAMAGRRDLKIKTEYGNAVVPAESSGLIEQNANGAMRLIALSGKPSSFSMEAGGKTTVISAEPGEEVVVGDESLGEEEMIPVDGVDRNAVIDGSIKVAGYNVTKNRFNKKQLMEREWLISCNMGSSFFMRRKDKLLQNNYISTRPIIQKKTFEPTNIRTSQSTTAKTATAISTKVSGASSTAKTSSLKPAQPTIKVAQLKPVAFSSAASIEPQSSGLFTIETESSKVKHSPESRVHLDSDGTVVLKSGEALICADRPTKVKAGNYEVFVDKGGIVLVKQSAHHFTVANLYEPKSNCLRVAFNKQYASAAVGNELVFAEDGAFVSTILRTDKIGRRRVRAFDLGESMELTKSEISVASLMQNRDVLSRLLKSEHPLDKDISQRLMKMAACIAVTSASHGPYHSNGQK